MRLEAPDNVLGSDGRPPALVWSPARRSHSLPQHYRSPPPPDCSPLRAGPTGEDVRQRIRLMSRWMRDFAPADRLTAFQALQPALSAREYHWLSSRLPRPDLHAFCPPDCQDFLRLLPDPLVRKILAYLEPTDLARAAQVCSAWRPWLEADWLWRRLAARSPWRLGPDEHAVQLARCQRRAPDGRVVWKDIFRERFKLRRCWLAGQCHVRTFEGHTGAVSCVQFDSSRIVSGSHDTTIRVWNIRTNSRWSVMTLTGHSGAVRCLHLEGDRVASGSTDRTIKVWDLDMQSEWSAIACKVTMIGHADTVRSVQMCNAQNLVVSGSYDATLKIWCLKTGTCLQTLRGHESRVLCQTWDGVILLSGSADKTIKIWNTGTAACRGLLRGHQDAVTCLSMEGVKIVSGSLDRTIKLWDLNSLTCVSTLDWMSSEGHTGVIRCLQADPWRIVSAADDKTLKVWNLASGQRLVTLRSHTDGVTCLRFNDFVIVSGSYDKTVKLWDFTVC